MKNNDVVPCDLLLLTGSAVVNEASLTGESVPQMKDRLPVDGAGGGAEGPQLDLSGRDRVHVMFAGTTLVTSTAGDGNTQANRAVPATPDGGCLCYVLRSGFLSAQGELMMMIEFSQQKVGDDSKDTMLALLILLVFALAASAFVFRVRSLRARARSPMTPRPLDGRPTSPPPPLPCSAASRRAIARRTSSCSAASSSSRRSYRATCRCRRRSPSTPPSWPS